jgi:hypothetical protein
MRAVASGLNDSFLGQNSAPPLPFRRGGQTNWDQHIPRKYPQRQGTLIDVSSVQAAFERSREVVSAEIEDLKKLYRFADDSVASFLFDHSAIRNVLRQAIEPLRASFGANSLFVLELSTDEDGSATLYSVVIWTAEVRSASDALNNFLETWWLHRMNIATSDLAFAYQIV